MPTLATANFPLTQSPEEFEDMVVDALRIQFDKPHLVRFGRSGQRQGGIDGLDTTVPIEQAIVWQATLRQPEAVVAKITRDLDRLDVVLQGKQPRMFIVALGAKRDAGIQTEVQAIATTRAARGGCPVLTLFWEDIRAQLSTDEALVRKYFAEFLAPAAPPGSGRVDRWASQIGRSITDWTNLCVDAQRGDLIGRGPVLEVSVGGGQVYGGVARLGTWDMQRARFVQAYGDGSADTVRLRDGDGEIHIPLAEVQGFRDVTAA